MKLSLLMTYRKRVAHLRQTLEWFEQCCKLNSEVELLLIESDMAPEIDPDSITNPRIRYTFVPMVHGVFHKTHLLNLALSQARGTFVIPYDIDIIPRDLSFQKYLKLAESSKHLLFTGHRLMSPKETISLHRLEEEFMETYQADEDASFDFLRSQLLHEVRFGVHPFYQRHLLEKIGGWDEAFMGWGAEDNDVMERYVYENDIPLVKSPDMAYLHLFHIKTLGWNEGNYLQNNHQLYHSKRQKRREALYQST